jgi:hypothetical protein
MKANSNHSRTLKKTFLGGFNRDCCRVRTRIEWVRSGAAATGACFRLTYEVRHGYRIINLILFAAAAALAGFAATGHVNGLRVRRRDEICRHSQHAGK